MSELQPQPSSQDETILNEEQEQLPTSTATFRQRAARFLFEPHPSITEVGSRRQAELLSALTLVLFTGTGIGVSYLEILFASAF